MGLKKKWNWKKYPCTHCCMNVNSVTILIEPGVFLGCTPCCTCFVLGFFSQSCHYISGHTMQADTRKYTQWQQREEHTDNWHQVHLEDRESCRVTPKSSKVNEIGWVEWKNGAHGGKQYFWAHPGIYSSLAWGNSFMLLPKNQEVPLACGCLCFHCDQNSGWLC